VRIRVFRNLTHPTAHGIAGYLYDAAEYAGFQERWRATFGFSGTDPEPFGISGTIIGISGTGFGLI